MDPESISVLIVKELQRRGIIKESEERADALRRTSGSARSDSAQSTIRARVCGQLAIFPNHQGPVQHPISTSQCEPLLQMTQISYNLKPCDPLLHIKDRESSLSVDSVLLG